MIHTKSPRIGPRMLEAADIVASMPGCPILPVARAIGPRGSLKYGYAAVHRAIKAGLICYDRDGKGGAYRLYPAQESAQ